MTTKYLETDVIRVAINPDQGCDITSIIHRASGRELLFQSPWVTAGGSGHCTSWAADSATAWLDRYPGGWQLLLPNGGPACTVGGTEWVFHGEASQSSWAVVDHDDARLTTEIVLRRAPLAIHRTLDVDGGVLHVTDIVTNRGVEAIDMVWGHHPAFGAGLIDSSTRVTTSASVFTADRGAPGTHLAAGRQSSWPEVACADGQSIDLSVLRDEGAGVAHLGYLSGFDTGSVRIDNERIGLGVEMTWPLDVMPHAWYWVENCSSMGYPWFGRCHVFAFEPCSTGAAVGAVEAVAQDFGVVTLEASQTRSATVTLSVESSPARLER